MNIRKGLRVHYVDQGKIICNEEGSVLIQTIKPNRVTCLNCKKALRKGLPTSLFSMGQYAKKEAIIY